MLHLSQSASALARCLSAYALGVVVTTAALAQSSLSTTFAANNGGATGGMVYFDLTVANPAGVTIKKFDVNTAAPLGSLRVYTAPTGYVGAAGVPTAWTQVANGAIVAAGYNNPSEVCLGAGFYLPPGSYGVALEADGFPHAYTNGTGLPTLYSNADISVGMGAASNEPFGGSQFFPRLWNGTVYYDVGVTTAFSCAATRVFGTGCNAGATTWYEEFADLSSFDLGGSAAVPVTIRASNAGSAGYVVLPATPAWHVPTGTALQNNIVANPGPMTAGSFSSMIILPWAFPFPGGSTPALFAASNGWLDLGPNFSTLDLSLPSASALVEGTARIAPLWAVMDPTANLATNPAAGVYYDVDPVANAVYITWLDVGDARAGPPAAGTTSINMQCALFSNGDIEFRYGAMQWGIGPGAAMTGWSRGAGVPDPGSRDLSSSLPLQTDGPDNYDLRHRTTAPKLGSTLALDVSEVESMSAFAFLFVGDTAYPNGVSLASAGAPGCNVYANTLAAAAVPVPATAGVGIFQLNIPQSTTLIGVTLVSQYAALSQRNVLGISTSNGVSWTIGN